MHILGLDFATATGVAYGDAGAPADRIVTETWALPSGQGDDVGAYMHALRAQLDDRVMRGVSLVVFEAPIIVRHRGADQRWHESPGQIRRAFGAAAICEEVCHGRGVPALEVAPSSLKLSFAGHGRAEKPAMMLAASRRGFAPSNHNEADAIACWLHGVASAAREHLHLYDPISRGTLA